MNTADTVTESITPESVDAASVREPWHPPMRPIQIYLLIFLTFGIYLFFWTWRLAQDVKRHVDAGVKPWAHVVLSMLWFFWPLVAYKQASYIVKMNEAAGLPSRLSPLSIGLFVGALFATSIGLSLADLILEPTVAMQTWTLACNGIYVFVLPVPYILMQRNVNRYKETLGAANWTRKPYRFAVSHYVTMTILVPLYAFVAYSVYVSPVLQDGEPLEAGVSIGGDTGLYTLTPNTSNWNLIPAGTNEPGADLELYGSNGETSVIVYVTLGAGQTLDDRVPVRRTMVEEGLNDVSFEEQRGFLARTIIPVSHARYEGESAGFNKQTMLVTTVATPDALIEVVGTSVGDSVDGRAVEALISSFRLSGNSGT